MPRRIAPAGLMGKKAFQCWRGMQIRCYDKNNASFPSYGGRGIFVCDRWRNDFSAFLEDMGLPPSSAHSIDRIDNDGGYEPGNCRWATRTQQARNTRRSVKMTFLGAHVDPNEWADVMGFSRNWVYCQAHYHRLTGEEIIAQRWKNRHLVLAKLAKKKLRQVDAISLAESVESE